MTPTAFLSAARAATQRHHRSRLLLAGLIAPALFVSLASSALAKDHRNTKNETATAIVLPQMCGSKLQPPRIDWRVPGEVEGGLAQSNLNVVQRSSDLFSWQMLIALNWPAKAGQSGVPDTEKKLGAAGMRVWETWRDTGDVFRKDAKGNPLPPIAWNAPAPPVPASCRPGSRLLQHTSTAKDTLSIIEQPTGSRAGPVTLTDSKGRPTYFEVRVNKVAYDAIASGKWWDANRQNGLDRVGFPAGTIIAKAAWTPIDEADKSRFESMEACLCDAKPAQGEPACAMRQVGLVGFHLMSKTKSAPQWIWSTYEQKDNVGVPHATYANPKGSATPNLQTAPGVPNQLTRVIPIPSQEPICKNTYESIDNIQRLNHDMQKALHPAPLANYMLINTQWPLAALAAPADKGRAPHTVFKVRPELLGNTTLESFIQDTSSCMGCHSMARTQRPGRFVSSDFTFVLNDAAPSLPNPLVMPGPVQSEVAAQVWHGHQLVNKTYEMLPSNAKAKLHCSSCHLDGGRNVNAAWFRGAVAYQDKNLPDGGIARRINQCFTNSLNGTALCTPDVPGQPTPPNACSGNEAMQSIIAYMKWIDAQPSTIPAPPSPFPPIPNTRLGEAGNGERIYMQKCAFCHGDKGQGRYQEEVYFRPALWGPHSFNKQAGMDTHADLARFVYSNMPLHSGGELTAQESSDLACFIDGKERPAGPGPSSHVRSGAAPITCSPRR